MAPGTPGWAAGCGCSILVLHVSPSNCTLSPCAAGRGGRGAVPSSQAAEGTMTGGLGTIARAKRQHSLRPDPYCLGKTSGVTSPHVATCSMPGMSPPPPRHWGWCVWRIPVFLPIPVWPGAGGRCLSSATGRLGRVFAEQKALSSRRAERSTPARPWHGCRCLRGWVAPPAPRRFPGVSNPGSSAALPVAAGAGGGCTHTTFSCHHLPQDAQGCLEPREDPACHRTLGCPSP